MSDPASPAAAPAVFISYASADGALVEPLADALATVGIECWRAPRSVPAGANFAEAIVRGIAGARVFLLLVSRAALASVHVQREIALAVGEHLTIVPVAVDRSVQGFADLPDQWRYWLNIVQIVPFADVPSLAALVRERVAERTAQPAAGAQGASPSPSLVTAAEREQLCAQLFERAPRPVDDIPPSFLLRPQIGVVPFTGRDEELTVLHAWCTGGQADLRVRLIAGAGGQGKSRLAMEILQRMHEEGWAGGFLRPGTDPAAARRLADLGTPVLIVVDYAETRTSELVALLELLDDEGARGRVRLLLLARTDGDWWSSLATAHAGLEYLLEAAPVMRLQLPATPADDLYRLAAASFARHLGVPEPPHDEGRHEQDARVLALHVAALSAVLERQGDSEQDPDGTSGPLRRILIHERRYWRKAAQEAQLGAFDDSDLDRAVATSFLVGAAHEREAVAALRVTSPLQDERHLVGLARLIRRLYPSTTAYWGRLQPTALGEELVAQVTRDFRGSSASTAFPHAPIRAGAPAQQRRGLLVLARASSHYEEFGRALDELLQDGSLPLATAAIAVAPSVDAPDALVRPLRAVVQRHRLDRTFLHRLHDELPEESATLAELSADIGQAVLDADTAAGAPVDESYVRLLNELANRLSDVGRHGPAAIAAELAARGTRQLADRGRAGRAQLAASLNNLSNRLSELASFAEAVAPCEEAAALLTRLATDGDAATEVQRVACRSNLAYRLVDVRRSAEALPIATEALDAARALAAADERRQVDVARCLTNVAGALGDLDQAEPAFEAIVEALEIRRHWAQQEPDAYLPNLARALNNVCVRAMALDRRAEARAAAVEAVAHFRALVRRSGRVFVPELASALGNGAVAADRDGCPADARPMLQEAERLFAELHRDHPQAYAVRLEVTRRNLGALDGLATAEPPATLDADARRGLLYTKEFRDLA